MRGRWTICIAAVLAVSLVSASTAAASGYKDTLTDIGTVTTGNPIIVTFDVGASFSSISTICFKFTFHGDLLDPGEEFAYTPVEPTVAPGTGPGFFNPGTTPQHTRTQCLDPVSTPDLIPFFLDGTESLELSMRTTGSSVTVTRLKVTIDGVPL
jgi:hypothetical protein